MMKNKYTFAALAAFAFMFASQALATLPGPTSATFAKGAKFIFQPWHSGEVGTGIPVASFTIDEIHAIQDKFVEAARRAKEAGAEVLAAGHQNLFQHTVFHDGYVIEGAKPIADLLRRYSVSLFLSGHLHVQHFREENGLTEITGSALCSYPCQYGILENTGGVFSYETRRLDMKKWAEENNREEPVFQHFTEAAADYMTAHFKAVPAEVTDRAELEAMTAYLQQLNLAYFAGDLRSVQSLDPDGSLAQRWLEEKNLTALYVSSILKDAGSDFTHWKSQ